jgi:broad specificity phosphatase PhoE
MPAMGTIYLVRHGQASFGADDYDQLSPLGTQQAQQLGRYWQERDMCFDAVYTGTLKRHVQTLAGIRDTLPSMPDAQALPALNEYDSHALIRCVHPEPLGPVDTPEAYRAHFRLLCDAIAQWMAGVISPEGMPAWEDFSGAIRQTLEHIRHQHHAGNVLIVSSGGPISCASSLVLGATPEVSIALNMRIRNTAVTELSMSAKRLMLQTFNTLNHLDSAQTRDWITFA